LHIVATTVPNSAKFFTVIKTSKYSSWVVRTRVNGLDWFLPARRYASAVFAVTACSSVGLSVRLSQAGIISKRLNVGSYNNTAC